MNRTVNFRLKKLEANRRDNELRDLSDEELQARIDELDRLIGTHPGTASGTDGQPIGKGLP